ncbi:MAG: single-stranded DNA-binding protein, partial [Leptotrichia sp.]|nr:single-stranded DNA-binding protein [Leptotrichia sp.]
NFFNIKVIGKIADSYAKYTGKGSKVTVIGKMSLTNYEKNGEQKQWFEVLIQQLDSHSKKNTENNETEINETEDGNDFPF